MCSRGVLVHCPSRLGAAAAVLAAELPCGDGVLTKWALEPGKAVHHFDSVMSHSLNCSCLSRYDSELKLPSPALDPEDSRYWSSKVQVLGCVRSKIVRHKWSTRNDDCCVSNHDVTGSKTSFHSKQTFRLPLPTAFSDLWLCFQKDFGAISKVRV